MHSLGALGSGEKAPVQVIDVNRLAGIEKRVWLSFSLQDMFWSHFHVFRPGREHGCLVQGKLQNITTQPTI